MGFTDKQRELLAAGLEKKNVKKREAGKVNGVTQYVDYVGGHYVVERMNEVFGPDGWGYTVDLAEVARAEERQVWDNGMRSNRAPRETDPPHEIKVSWKCTYRCLVLLTVDGGHERQDVGYGQGKDRDLGTALEKAGKEAVTDALKRVCARLGNSMGLALYDKEQAGVIDTPESLEGARKGETDEEAEARRERHHPSFAKDRAKFNARLGALQFLYYDLCAFLQWFKKDAYVPPSQMDQKTRDNLIGWLEKDPNGAASKARAEWLLTRTPPAEREPGQEG